MVKDHYHVEEDNGVSFLQLSWAIHPSTLNTSHCKMKIAHSVCYTLHILDPLREVCLLIGIHTPIYVRTSLLSLMFAFDVPTLRSCFDDLFFSYPTDRGPTMSSTFTAELRKSSAIQTRLV